MFVGSWTTSQLKFPLKWPLLFDPLQWTNHKENTETKKNQLFPNPVESTELLPGKVLFLLQLETKSQYGKIT